MSDSVPIRKWTLTIIDDINVERERVLREVRPQALIVLLDDDPEHWQEYVGVENGVCICHRHEHITIYEQKTHIRFVPA